MAIDYMDLANRYASARLDQATRPFTDTEGYLNDRIKQNYGVDLYGNTKPKSMTITNNDDGSQTVTQKTEVAPQQQQGQPAYMPDENQAETQRLLAQNAAAAPEPAPMPAAVPTPVAQPNQMQARSLAPAPAPAAVPTPVAQPNPVQGTALPPVAPVAPDQTQAETNRLQAQAAAAAPVAPTPISTVGQAAVDQVNATQLPSASRGIQVAGGAPGVGLAPAPAPAAQAPMSIGAEPKPVPTPAQWQTDLTNIQRDPTKLAAYVGNEANPENARKVAATLWRKQEDLRAKGLDIEKLFVDASNGDVKAVNTLSADLKKRTEEGSLIKAYFYNRLGFTDLAKEEQMKINGGGVSSEIMDGEYYTVEKNARGQVVRAWNSDGASMNRDKIAKLQSSGQKVGTQAFGFTGEPAIVTDPDGNQAEVRQRTNSISGNIENIYVTGPNAGKVYTGSDIPIPKSISTSAAKADYKVISGLREKFGTNVLDAEKQYQIDNGPFASQAARDDFRQKYGFVSGMPGGGPSGLTVSGAAAGGASTAGNVANVPPAAGGASTATKPATGNAPVGNQPVALGAAPIRSNYASDSQYKMAVENYNKLRDYNLAVAKEQAAADIQQKKELNVAEQKPPAEAKGKNVAKDVNNQNFANETYGLIRPVADLIKQSTGSGLGTKADTLAAFFGKSTEGAQAIAQLDPLVYPILANVPRFEGPQGEYDVKVYQKAAGAFSDSEKPIGTRLAALQGMITLLKKYDKEGKNDWTFGGTNPSASGGIRIISRERVQ